MNRKFKTLLVTILTVTLSCSLLAGCGSDSQDGENGKVKLELFSNKSENKNILQSMVKEFEKKNPNIEITINDPPKASTVLKTRLTKNDMPDILSIGGDSTYSDLVKADALEDLSNDSFNSKVQNHMLKCLTSL